jgi:hypothetical protein
MNKVFFESSSIINSCIIFCLCSSIINSFLPLSIDRYVDKPDLLPLKVVVEFLEERAEKLGV